MRSTCPDCGRKHIAEAIVSLGEARLGYLDHVWLAIGQLSHAEQELIERFPDIALYLREQRIELQRGRDVLLLPVIRLISSYIEEEGHVSDENFSERPRDLAFSFTDWSDLEYIKRAVKAAWIRAGGESDEPRENQNHGS